MNKENQVYQTPRKDLVEGYRKCWRSDCKGSAWFEDWGGWRWCWKHAWREIVQNETWGNTWFEIKTMKIRYPFGYDKKYPTFLTR